MKRWTTKYGLLIAASAALGVLGAILVMPSSRAEGQKKLPEKASQVTDHLEQSAGITAQDVHGAKAKLDVAERKIADLQDTVSLVGKTIDQIRDNATSAEQISDSQRADIFNRLGKLADRQRTVESQVINLEAIRADVDSRTVRLAEAQRQAVDDPNKDPKQLGIDTDPAKGEPPVKMIRALESSIQGELTAIQAELTALNLDYGHIEAIFQDAPVEEVVSALAQAGELLEEAVALVVEAAKIVWKALKALWNFIKNLFASGNGGGSGGGESSGNGDRNGPDGKAETNRAGDPNSLNRTKPKTMGTKPSSGGTGGAPPASGTDGRPSKAEPKGASSLHTAGLADVDSLGLPADVKGDPMRNAGATSVGPNGELLTHINERSAIAIVCYAKNGDTRVYRITATADGPAASLVELLRKLRFNTVMTADLGTGDVHFEFTGTDTAVTFSAEGQLKRVDGTPVQ